MSELRGNNTSPSVPLILQSLVSILESRYDVAITAQIVEKETSDGRLFFYNERCEK